MRLGQDLQQHVDEGSLIRVLQDWCPVWDGTLASEKGRTGDRRHIGLGSPLIDKESALQGKITTLNN